MVALDDFVRALPSTVSRREQVQSTRRRTDVEIVGRFPDHWLDADTTLRQHEYGKLVQQLARAFKVAELLGVSVSDSPRDRG
jgi:hypothetical protein